MTVTAPAVPVGWSRYLHLWLELLGLCRRAYPGRTTGLLAVKAVSSVNVAATALALQATVDGIVRGDVTGAAAAGAGAAAAYALSAYLLNLDFTLTILMVDSVGALDMTRRINGEIVGLDALDHLERTEVLDRITVVQTGGWSLVYGAWTVVDVVAGAVRLGLTLLLLGTVSPWLLLLLLFAALPLWLDRRGQRAVAKAETDTAEVFRLQRHLFNLATEAVGGKEIRVSGAGHAVTEVQARAWDEAVRGRIRARLRAAGHKVVGWVLFTAGFVGGLVMLLDRAARGQGSLGDVVLAITIAVTLRDSIQMTVARVSRTASSAGVVDAYLWLQAYAARERDADAGDLPVPAALREGITLEGVRFSYPGTGRATLDGLDCHLPAGSVVAVVGEYGSGKTSLIKLLCKLYQPDAGTIRVDGIDLARLVTTDWHARTSAAFQDFGRFQIRFRQTVGLGDVERLDDHEAVREAIRAADADTLVQRLPEGMDTQLGRRFGGVDLSEGQWQKTALARASMRRTPLLFVLDEPTASLDAPSEHAIFERYMARARELSARTGTVTVIVSHRFSTVTDADLILVLDAGRIAESGTHDELLAIRGRYAQLYGIQAKAYAAG
ncbi:MULTISPECIES: ABC transporter ATP-binding protein [unclassified Streptomyces]|uniref:ABC transporter ATP-binding protein n=1 Tax=unclassified Streptomyces TaxID=2593676 RepID=UPI0005A7A4A2|nr:MULTISPECIES: ABC transporter ATP-binding protein [unclassified Streptomyces]ODA70155.1 Lipid A export ATP-binding/permease protein MsbA [Streptomyces sp. AVP053U2]